VRTTASPKSQPQSIGRASLTQPSDPTAPPCGHEHWNVVEDFLISINVAALILLYSCRHYQLEVETVHLFRLKAQTLPFIR
jgi:hypothetical protein